MDFVYAGSQGGAVYMVNGTSLAVSESSFTNNTALTGGGIYMSRISETYIYDSCFYHNNVTQEGGGVFASGSLNSCIVAVESAFLMHCAQTHLRETAFAVFTHHQDSFMCNAIVKVAVNASDNPSTAASAFSLAQ